MITGGTPSGHYTLEDRARCYSKVFPDGPPLTVDDRWLTGMWLLADNHRGSRFHGAYPHGYLRQIVALFPDAKKVLHLFSGSLQKSDDYVRFDIRPKTNPDIVGDAHHLLEHFTAESFDLVLADPPYSEEDARHHRKPMVDRNTAVTEAMKVLRPGGHLVWLDQVMPMYRAAYLRLWGVIGIIRSTNRRVRAVFMFERLYPGILDGEDGMAE